MKIKKTVLCLLLCAALGAAALAAGGTEDPLVSLSYLAGTFSNTVDREIEQRLDAALDQLSQCYSAGEAREEVTLEDVQAFDQDPAAQEETPAQAAPAPVEAAPAEEAPAATPAPAEENENLPFEG